MSIEKAEYEDYIKEEPVKQAFRFLDKEATKLKQYNFVYKCYKGQNGKKKRTCVYKSDSDAPFSFIVNKKHLLFYFRHREQTHKTLTVEELMQKFHKVGSGNSKNELSVYIYSLDDAKRIMSVAFGHDC